MRVISLRIAKNVKKEMFFPEFKMLYFVVVIFLLSNSWRQSLLIYTPVFAIANIVDMYLAYMTKMGPELAEKTPEEIQ